MEQQWFHAAGWVLFVDHCVCRGVHVARRQERGPVGRHPILGTARETWRYQIPRFKCTSLTLILSSSTQWVLVWILPFFIFSAISLFDRFDTTSVWVIHFWRGPQFGWYRRRNCVPQSTYNTLCTVPIVNNETQWCIDNYNLSLIHI